MIIEYLTLILLNLSPSLIHPKVMLNLGPIKHKDNNLTREERKYFYDLRNDTSIIIKEADKGSVIVIWDKEDYLKEAEKQLSCKEM